MIVVVEGPTAAGKTSWCRRYVGRYVAEYAATGREPTDAVALARHWARAGMRRWAQAIDQERTDGVAFCDTDPVKLHYSWGMAMLGLAPRAQFDRELAVTRVAVRMGRLGLADAVLVGLPDLDSLQRRRAAGGAAAAVVCRSGRPGPGPGDLGTARRRRAEAARAPGRPDVRRAAG